jgi:hypothetical protein
MTSEGVALEAPGKVCHPLPRRSTVLTAEHDAEGA